MRILLIEDDSSKRQKIMNHINSFISDDSIVSEKESLRSGLKEILHGEKLDLILLDMSMPSFDIGTDEPGGGTPESFAGEELMAQMKLRSIIIPVIVITQYDSFEEGRVTLNDLSAKFEQEFNEFYLGSVYYNSAVDSWKTELEKYLTTALGK